MQDDVEVQRLRAELADRERQMRESLQKLEDMRRKLEEDRAAVDKQVRAYTTAAATAISLPVLRRSYTCSALIFSL